MTVTKLVKVQEMKDKSGMCSTGKEMTHKGAAVTQLV